MVQRLSYRRQNNFNTRSNKVKVIKTPGGKLAYQMVKKNATGPRCGDCKCKIIGVPCLRPYQYKRLHKRECTVSRAYGGSRCMNCVRERVIRAFLIEEQKCVKAFMVEKDREDKKTKAEEAKAAPKKSEKKSEKKAEKKAEKPAETAPKAEEKKKSSKTTESKTTETKTKSKK